MNNNTQIETVEDFVKRISSKYTENISFKDGVKVGLIEGINWRKQQDEAEIKRLNYSYEDSLSMQRCSNAGYESKINEWEAEYKELLDSHNELLEVLKQVESNCSDAYSNEYMGLKMLILVDKTINKAKNIKL